MHITVSLNKKTLLALAYQSVAIRLHEHPLTTRKSTKRDRVTDIDRTSKRGLRVR